MMALLALLILLLPASHEPPAQPDPFPVPLFGPVIPPTVLVGQAAWDMRLRNRPLQVCGYLFAVKTMEKDRCLRRMAPTSSSSDPRNRPSSGKARA
jgi:hypothetical protein